MRAIDVWWIRILLLVTLLIGGCVHGDSSTLRYFGDDSHVKHYQEVAQTIAYPYDDGGCHEERCVKTVAHTEEPRTVRNRRRDKINDLSLMDAVHTALANSRIIRSDGQFLSTGNSLYTNAENVPSIHDAAIQESGVLFGRRSVEAALADFDTRLTTSMNWGRSETVQNSAFFGGGITPGSTSQADIGAFRSSLAKRFADGGSFLVGHDWDYAGRNSPGQLFPSVYTGNLRAEYRRPLWAGSGTEYTRIAGPSNPNFGSITGVSQGVTIARINSDITLGNFQMAVRNLVRDVENVYWELYLAYRLYDSAVVARESALQTWTEAKAKLAAGGIQGFDRASEPQARAQYFAARAAAEARLGGDSKTARGIYYWEGRLRRLLGLPVNDGTILRTADEPVQAEIAPNWDVSLTEALLRRPELRQQKWSIKSLRLQLQAAKSLTKPSLDFVSSYQVNAFGDHLLGQNDNDSAGTAQGLNSAYESLSQGNQTGWTLGLQLSMPLGFRSAKAQVRNYELRLTKANDLLAAQELEISHELANAFRNMAVNYANMKSNYERLAAERERVEIYEKRKGKLTTVDIVLRAQRDRAQAESAYYQSLIEYNKAIAELNFRKGTLLEYNSISLAEGEWTPAAYQQALRKARARTHAFPNRLLHTEPLEFAVPEGQQYGITEPGIGTVQTTEPTPKEVPKVSAPAPAAKK